MTSAGQEKTIAASSLAVIICNPEVAYEQIEYRPHREDD
jgi:hypothetical protein